MKLIKRKGDPTDVFVFLIIIFFLAISFVVVLFANSKIQEVISTTALNESDAYSSINSSFNTINLYTVQRGFTIFFALMIMGIMISSFLIRVHPIFIGIYIITLASAIFTAVFLANSYALVVANEQFAALSTNYTMITWVMRNVIKILLAVGALSMIIIFGKLGSSVNSGVDI